MTTMGYNTDAARESTPESRLVIGCCAFPRLPLTEESEMIEIPLTRGQVALIDEEDFELVSRYSWQAQWNQYTKTFYARANSLKREGRLAPLYMHRLILEAEAGEFVDHINHDTLNNQKYNIRLCSRSENMMNRGKSPSNKSGYKGVYWDKQRNKWHATIQYNGKKKHLCFSDDPEICYADYCNAAKLLHKEFARVS